MSQKDFTRIMVISDIHGSNSVFTAVLKRYKREKADHLLIAGDITARYSEHLAKKLNAFRNHITAVHGNCDSSWEDQILFFPRPGYQQFEAMGRTIFMTHGNHMSPAHPPLLPPGSIFVSGHTHRPDASYLPDRDLYLLNPGSCTSPRGGDPPSYGIITSDGIEVRDLYHAGLLMQVSLKN